MTKKQEAARKEAWKQALREYRVVRCPDFGRLTAYKTETDARAACRELQMAGINAEIITNYQD